MAKLFLKLSAALCAVILLGAWLCYIPAGKGGAVLSASAATPSYQMSEGYKSGRFYKNFTSVKLTGDQRKDVLAIALSQLGYHEGDSDSDFDGESASGVSDFVEYNVLAGKYDNGQGNGLSYGYYWCASFVNWCLRQAGVAESASAGSEISCQRWLADCRAEGIYKIRGSYIPRPADMIFFRDKGSAATATHIGFVLYVSGNTVYTVEGNTSFTNDYSSDGEYVAVKCYPLDSDYIVGYASPNYNSDKSSRRVDHSGGFKTRGQYIPHGRVEVFADQEMTQSLGEMDAFTLFDVTAVTEGALSVKASVGGVTQNAFISDEADVIQVTSDQDVYCINYVDGDGNAVFAPQYRLSGQKKKTYSNAPERDGCGFVGWQYSAGGNTAVYSAGDELAAVDADMTLVALFDSNFYVVSFQTPDKILISQSFGYYGTPIQPPTPKAPDGYVFAGWDQEPTQIIVGNATYTAVFTCETESESAAETGDGKANGQRGCGSTLGAIPAALIMLPSAVFSFTKKKKTQK